MTSAPAATGPAPSPISFDEAGSVAASNARPVRPRPHQDSPEPSRCTANCAAMRPDCRSNGYQSAPRTCRSRAAPTPATRLLGCSVVDRNHRALSSTTRRPMLTGRPTTAALLADRHRRRCSARRRAPPTRRLGDCRPLPPPALGGCRRAPPTRRLAGSRPLPPARELRDCRLRRLSSAHRRSVRSGPVRSHARMPAASSRRGPVASSRQPRRPCPGRAHSRCRVGGRAMSASRRRGPQPARSITASTAGSTSPFEIRPRSQASMPARSVASLEVATARRPRSPGRPPCRAHSGPRSPPCHHVRMERPRPVRRPRSHLRCRRPRQAPLATPDRARHHRRRCTASMVNGPSIRRRRLRSRRRWPVEVWRPAPRRPPRRPPSRREPDRSAIASSARSRSVEGRRRDPCQRSSVHWPARSSAIGR